MQVRSSSNRATVQAALDVSKARIMGGMMDTCSSTPQPPRQLDCLDGFDFRHVMPNQALDPALQSHRRGRAARAGAVHRDVEVTVLVTLVDDVAAILRNGGANARL